MAVTKIWKIKTNLSVPIEYVKNPEKTKNPDYDQMRHRTMEDLIEYVANEDKTEQHYFIEGINCNTTYAREQFEAVKAAYDKSDGILLFHGYQSFKEGECDSYMAHQIGIKLAEEMWGDRFQVIVATHLNTNCLHNHFLINSVSFKDGRKYHDCRDEYRRMRETSDRLCREYGLSVIENPRKNREPTNLYRAEKAGMPTRYNVARMAIDEALSSSCNVREFEMNLRRMGYATRFDYRRKYWTVTPAGWSKPIRLERLGEDYSKERILERLGENPESVRLKDFHRGNRYSIPTRGDKIRKVGGLKGLYLKYCYQLGYLPRYTQRPTRIHPSLREDLLKCEMFSRQVRMITANGIDSMDGLEAFIEKTTGAMNKLSVQRDELRKRLRRVAPESEKEVIRKRISEITARMKILREDIKLSNDIKERAESIEEKLKETEINKKEKER